MEGLFVECSCVLYDGSQNQNQHHAIQYVNISFNPRYHNSYLFQSLRNQAKYVQLNLFEP